MKKLILIIITLIMTLTYSSVVLAAGTNTQKQQTDKSKVTQKQAAQNEIKVILNNKALKLKNQPYLKSGKVLIPFKEALESIDKGVKWEENQQVVYTKLASSEIYIKIGVNYGYLNGYKTQLELAPEQKGNIIYVPFSLIGEGLGADTNWDSKSKTLNIKYVNTVYKIGEAGTYNKTKFSIDSVDSKTLGELRVIGKVNSNNEKVVIEVSDDNGYILTQTMTIGEKTGDFYNMSGSLSLPTCHNFVAKRVTLKIMNKDNKLVKIGEYKI
jgi:hypothetical protein